MNLWFPKIKWRLLPGMLGIASLGAMVSGSYGIVHDQITYTISEEYFTKLKFSQFHYADFGLGRRAFVAEIGFLATWWVGFFSAWFLARIAVPVWNFYRALTRCMLGCFVIFTSSLCGALIGFTMSFLNNDGFSSWSLCEDLYIEDCPAFVRVAYIHNAGYLGAFIGLIIAILLMRRWKKFEEAPPIDGQSSVDEIPR